MPTSKNYCWKSNSLLGSGAVGEVYKGYHLDTGESVAIKVMKKFNVKQMSHLLSLQDRELEVLRKLDHPNIVKLIDVEPEPEKLGENNHGKKIIIMELCTGGSLYNLLTSPENVFGLDDKEFLNVLRGIASGMEKLHMENIVHRDIKPGNIMRFIGDDGRTIYKLIDFGAARELHNEQEFESIYGTEEYLHPGIYEKAFIDNDSDQSFKHSVDLWSIGATLYHVAAGQIPFQSFNGRKDRMTMYDIIANKKSGDISGIQKVRGGKIIYGQQLPDECIMSVGLRPLVENLLARLLETDDAKAMSFEDFFRISKNIIDKKLVSVFDCNSTKVLKIYIDPACEFHEFQESLKSQTCVDSVLLLYENLDFVEQFGGDKKVMTCGEVVDSNPVYLFSKPSPAKNLDEAKYNIPVKPAVCDVSNCLNFSRYCCESLNFIKRNVDACLLRQKLINTGAIMLIRFLSRRVDKFSIQSHHLADLSRAIQLGLEKFELLTSHLLSSNQNALGKTARNSLGRQRDLFSEVTGEIKSIISNISELELKLQVAVNLWVGEKPSCKEDDCCLSRIEVAVKQVMEIHQEFSSTKQDDLIRKVKCRKLENYCSTAKSLIEGQCQVNARELVEVFRSFMRSIWPEKKTFEDLDEAFIGQFQRQKLLLESMEESFKRVKKSIKLPALKLESSKEGNRSLSVEEGRLILRRRESVEKKFTAQLFSITSDVNNANLSAQLVPLVEENNKILEGIVNLVKKNLSVSSSTDGKETETFHGNPSSHVDRTLT